MNEQGRTEDIFEREWREAFDGVEQTPPRIVWSEIDRAMAHGKALVYKKRSVYYRWMAAAIFLLATSIGLLQLLNEKSGFSRTIAQIDVDSPQQVLLTEIEIPQSWDNFGSADQPPTATNKQYFTNGGNQQGGNQQNGNKTLFLASNENPSNESETESAESEIEFDAVINLVLIEAIKPNTMIASIDLVDHMYRVPMPNYSKNGIKNNKLDDRYWAGVDFGSATFDPNFQTASSSFLNNSLAFDPATQFSAANTEALDNVSPSIRENMQSGQSFAYGFNLGMKLTNRWSVQGGLQYVTAQATNNTNVVISTTTVVESIAATSQIKNVAQVRQAVQSDEIVEYNYQDVDLNNAFQFASIPVQAGYKILDSKFSVDLKAGIAANLYLGNKLTDPDNKLADVTIGPGSNSPYKELSFMGLAGVKFGYEFIRRFNLVIEPNYRQALDNITKSSSEFVSAPSGFGLQTGISYQFN
ncbi:MAG: hypothetical protein ACJA08_001843 [Cyclobacteriaceae bacterium]|jgi:hypothetical protein